ncbi:MULTISPECIES: dTDP-4-dehydrorhamnose reductase [Rhizobium]|uniref:dTDP-4-dehydrorhamnose reductase n=1 Tax=Rhizobium favelukesii TaxID=348824 RepID=W6RL64_9HYPH|nr:MULTISPECIES: dTDP-4-dehydrorhamnose reductase [Rhizobium]MCA0804798.1 dTDP-4-dehydrorhamnose reductase [Rhizobium sp. T1473]MCS0458361.1 dTDP-4-dehydrorhamnose reductase [Rhizobium favelukesii]UFS79820.1 dTDP-4-dehydrorhamnose reductase [Rhizobium sp. T136]CDM61529.1 dTDP-4-dehydrorhamnose reductase [Rhizobium favelukesii]
MNILLLGKNGQVGRELHRTLLPLGAVTALERRDLDMAATDTLPAILEAHAPDLIVNAAAWTEVDRAESTPDTAFRINADAPQIIARFARDRGATLIHYSTDYVFDGRKQRPYVESDDTNPLNVYGQSKRAGEQAIKASGCRFVILRTSWVFSATGANFINTILRLARERPTLRIVADQFGAPTSAELIADVTALAVAAHRQGQFDSGIYHLTAQGQTSWHELAFYVVRRARELGFTLRTDVGDIEPIATEEYPLPAARPRNSLLNCDALASCLGLDLPYWSVHVDRMLDQLREREPQT